MGDTQTAAGRRQSLTPYLIVKDAPRAIDFYTRAFGAEETFRLDGPDGKVGHAEIRIGDSYLMLADEHPDFGALGPLSIGGSPVTLHLYVDDVDRVVAGAASAGAVVLRAVKQEFYGDRTGMIVDPFGHRWHLATTVEPVSEDEMKARYAATMTNP
jgi:PhnB protein